MAYRIYDKHLSQNQINCIGEFDTLEEAKKQLVQFFTIDIETYDSDELQSQAKIKLGDGKIIDFKEFCKLEEVEGYEYILESDSYDYDSHRYYIEEYNPVYQAEKDKMKYPYYQIRCATNGDVLEDCQTIAQVRSTIRKWEADDKKEGNYEDDFYEVYLVPEYDDDIKIDYKKSVIHEIEYCGHRSGVIRVPVWYCSDPIAKAIARKEYGRSGVATCTRVESSAMDGTYANFQSFIGLPGRYGGLDGGNIYFTIHY